MRTRVNIHEMNERELRKYTRTLRLQRERRKKCLTALIAAAATVCMILICSVSYRALDTNANNGFKYYTDITVETGESLWEIAGEYVDGIHYDSRESYISEVCSINHLTDENAISAGQMLILPYYSNEYIQ